MERWAGHADGLSADTRNREVFSGMTNGRDMMITSMLPKAAYENMEVVRFLKWSLNFSP